MICAQPQLVGTAWAPDARRASSSVTCDEGTAPQFSAWFTEAPKYMVLKSLLLLRSANWAALQDECQSDAGREQQRTRMRLFCPGLEPRAPTAAPQRSAQFRRQRPDQRTVERGGEAQQSGSKGEEPNEGTLGKQCTSVWHRALPAQPDTSGREWDQTLRGHLDVQVPVVGREVSRRGVGTSN